jgi:hypothetical protein
MAAAALYKRNEPRGQRALLAAARRGDSDVALEAWPFLLAAGDPATEPALEAALSDDDYEAAREMAASLLTCGNPRLARAARERLDGASPKPRRKLRWGAARGRV